MAEKSESLPVPSPSSSLLELLATLPLQLSSLSFELESSSLALP